MVRVLSLLWTFILAVLITSVSFFYIRGSGMRGFPFSFAFDRTEAADGALAYSFNYWLLAFDLIIWWLLFSVLWIIVKNYILQID